MIKFILLNLILLFSFKSLGATAYPNLNVGLASLNDTILSLGTNYLTGTDTYTGTASGVVLNSTSLAFSNFSVTCVNTGTVTSWTAVLEGSLDNITFTTLLTHTNVIGAGVIVASTSQSPLLYFRSRVSAFVLGIGTNIKCTILGVVR